VSEIFKRSGVPAQAHPIVRFIFQEINAQRVPQEELAERSGVSSSTIRKWRRRERTPNMLQVEAVLNTLGYDLCIAESRDEGARSGRVVLAAMNRGHAGRLREAS
jgi:transcriptional regulator with XRE-family HTH domain